MKKLLILFISLPFLMFGQSPEVCSSNGMSMIQIFSNGTTSNNYWTLDVGCTSTSNIKAQIRCVKD